MLILWILLNPNLMIQIIDFFSHSFYHRISRQGALKFLRWAPHFLRWSKNTSTCLKSTDAKFNCTTDVIWFEWNPSNQVPFFPTQLNRVKPLNRPRSATTTPSCLVDRSVKVEFICDDYSRAIRSGSCAIQIQIACWTSYHATVVSLMRWE